MSEVIATAKAFPLYSFVEVTRPLNPMKGGYLWHSPFKDVGVIAQVTGYGPFGDLILNGNRGYSVNPQRVTLLDAGVIVKGLYSQEVIPEEFNSVFDAPIGMVLAYTVQGELAAGAVYPYLMRTRRGIWGYCPSHKGHSLGGWVFLTPGTTTEDNMPYLHDLQRSWTRKVAFVETFDYPTQAEGGLDKLRNELIEESNNA